MPFAPQIIANNVNCLNETTPIYGFEVAASPAVGQSIMIGYDYGITCGPVFNLPPASETGTSSRPYRGSHGGGRAPSPYPASSCGQAQCPRSQARLR